MPEGKRRNERLIVLLVLGTIALNFPLLSLFSRMRLLFGVPILYLYIFAVWYLFIMGVALIMERPTSSPLPPPPKADRPD